MRGTKRPSRFGACLAVLGVVGTGCFGSQYAAEGRHARAAGVIGADVAGIALLVGGAYLLDEAPSELGDAFPSEAFVGVGALVVGGALILDAETRYFREKRHEEKRRRIQ